MSVSQIPEAEELTDRVAVWRHPGFRRLWTGETASQFGAQVGGLALSVLAVSVLNASEQQVGVLSALQTAAFLVIGLPAGAWVDRWRKRRTMVAADLVRTAAYATIPVLWFFDRLTIGSLMAVAVIAGAATVFFDVSYQSFVPALVGRRHIGEANGNLEASVQVARIAGPGLGGWLLGVLAAPIVLVVTSATYLFSAAAVRSIPGADPLPERQESRSLRQEIRDGASFLLREPIVGPLVGCITVGALFSAMTSTLLPILALRHLGLSAATLGSVMSVGAIGGIAGLLARPTLTARFGEGRTMTLSYIIGGVVSLATPIAALVPSGAQYVLMGGTLVSSFFAIVFNVGQVSLRQRLCPAPLLGRLNATFRFLVWGAMPIGSLLAGFLAAHMGLVPTMWLAGLGALCAQLAVTTTPVWRLPRLPEGPGYDLAALRAA